MSKTLKCICISILLLSSCAHAYPYRDRGISAIEGHDQTALIEACGSQIQVGYAYCRKTEGASTEEMIYFLGPRTNCNKDFCVEFKIFNLNGELIYGNSIPKKLNRVGIKWKEILKRDSFELSDRGFWSYIYNVFWVDKDGHENMSRSEGHIFLRVLKQDYLPLNEVVKDSNYTWFFVVDGQHIKMTTGMRAFVSQK